MEKILILEKQLQEAAPYSIRKNVLLRDISYWKIGGIADFVAEPRNVEELRRILGVLNKFNDIPKMIMGDGSNLLFDDEGYRGVLIKLGNDMSAIHVEGDTVYCEAGAWVPHLAYQLYQRGLSGVEHICGIPGRFGGLVYMNGGSNRRGILENVSYVDLVSDSGRLERVYSEDLEHAYRTSPFQNDPCTIAGAGLSLAKKEKGEIRKQMRSILASRRKKFPRKLPNCGSVFLSNPKMYDVIGPPGFAIEKVGLKGRKKGNAQISELHANFIVNNGGASSSDVLYLIALARKKVFESTKFLMECEVRYINPNGVMQQAHIKADELWG